MRIFTVLIFFLILCLIHVRTAPGKSKNGKNKDNFGKFADAFVENEWVKRMKDEPHDNEDKDSKPSANHAGSSKRKKPSADFADLPSDNEPSADHVDLPSDNEPSADQADLPSDKEPSADHDDSPSDVCTTMYLIIGILILIKD
uniref:Uncharacterized protein n=1 Tax=Sipha flava TaxID=143950 RepID=A0A2S2QTS2_9HEMI